MTKAKVYVGTSGFSNQNFYPPHTKSDQKLPFYSHEFPTVEINSTFYHYPREKTLKHWKQSVSEDFVFTFKVFQGFTHFKEGEFKKDKFFEWLDIFKDFSRKKPQHLILFQFPATFQYSQEKLEELLSDLPKTFLYAFEFRHPTWFNPQVYEQLIKKGCTLVLSDGPTKTNGEPLWSKVDLNDAPFSYIRFHGSPQLYASSYSKGTLVQYAQLIKQKLKKGQNVYVYFNNDARGFATENAQTLIQLLT